MKSAITFVTLGLGLLGGCNNQPFGVTITYHPNQAIPEQPEEVVKSGRVDPSLPLASTVVIPTTLKQGSIEIASQSQPCLSIAACD